MLSVVTATRADPSTLYAACAAAAGALVAIMGGFLISRVVGLLSQKETLGMRARELAQHIRLAEAHLARVHDERLWVTIEWFDSDHLQDMAKQRGEVDIEAFVAKSNYRGSNADEMREVAKRRATQVRDAFAALEQAVPNGEVPDPRTLTSVTIPEGQECIWKTAAEELSVSRRPPPSRRSNPLGIPGLDFGHVVPPHIPTSDLPYQRQDARIRDEQRANAEIAALQAEVAVIDQELANLATGLPRIIGSILILAYFALGSVALPLALLAWPTVPSGPFARWGVWVLFVSGLVLLVGFLVWVARPLQAKPSSRGGTRDDGST